MLIILIKYINLRIIINQLRLILSKYSKIMNSVRIYEFYNDLLKIKDKT
jgi:hypothetical protein